MTDSLLQSYQRHSFTSVVPYPVVVVPPEGALLLLDGETQGYAIDATGYDDITVAAYVGGPVGGTVAVIDTGTPANDLDNVALDSSSLVQSGTSPKMVHFNSAPYVRWSPHNLILQSQTSNVGSWSSGGAGVTTTADSHVSPDGTTTGDTLAAAGTGNNIRYQGYAGFVDGFAYCFSVYAKAGTMDWIQITLDDFGGRNVKAWFNVTTGTPGSTTAASLSVIGTGITSAGNGWYRCYVSTATNTTGTYNVTMGPADADADINTDSGESAVFWGAQLNRGIIPTPYLVTTTAARIGIPQSYDAYTSQYGMLVEPAATNLCLRSETFGTTWGATNVTVGGDATTSPDGATTADKLTCSGGNVVHQVVQSSMVGGATGNNTCSVYMKAAELNYGYLACGNHSSGNNDWVAAEFDLSNGSVVMTDSESYTSVSSGIISVGNGWYRCWIAASMAAAPQFVNVAPGTGSLVIADGNNATPPAFSSDNNGIYVWGAQLEVGLVATSYTPTVSASATRAGDNVNFAFASMPWSTSAATVGVLCSIREAFAPNDILWHAGTSGTGSPHIIRNATVPQFSIFADAGSNTNFTANPAANTVTKMKAAFATGDIITDIDGSQSSVNTDAFTIASNTAFYFGHPSDLSSYNPQGIFFGKAVYVPRRVPNGSLTSWSF